MQPDHTFKVTPRGRKGEQSGLGISCQRAPEAAPGGGQAPAQVRAKGTTRPGLKLFRSQSEEPSHESSRLAAVQADRRAGSGAYADPGEVPGEADVAAAELTVEVPVSWTVHADLGFGVKRRTGSGDVAINSHLTVIL